MEKMKKIGMMLTTRILNEQATRDQIHGRGSFGATGIIENLFRYWLEDVLAGIGFKDMRREAPYPGQESKKGGKLSCDLVAKLRKSEFWIEIKVAYENTRYRTEDFTRDLDRLSRLGQSTKKVFLTVFVSKAADRPDKLEKIINSSRRFKAVNSEIRSAINVPDDWGWEKAFLFVNIFHW